MRYSRMTEEVKEERKSGRAGVVILVLFALGAVVYMIGAAKVGSFLSEKIIRPVVSLFDEDTHEAAEEVSSETGVSNEVSAEITFPAMKMWLLQVGAFGEKDNAEKSAGEIADMGGAGYILEEDGTYRVIIAGYAKEEDAANVKERLKTEQNMESKLLELSAESAVYTMKTEQSVIDTFAAAAEECGNYPALLMELSLRLDKGGISAAEAKNELSEMKDQIGERMEYFSDLSENSEDELLIRTQKYYVELHGAFSVFEEELSDIALSSRIKHCYISSAALYRDFLQNNVE